MKGIKTILSAMLLAAMAVSCNDNFDTPPMVTPTRSRKPKSVFRRDTLHHSATITPLPYKHLHRHNFDN